MGRDRKSRDPADKPTAASDGPPSPDADASARAARLDAAPIAEPTRTAGSSPAEAPPVARQLPESIAGYRVLREIGRGGMGVVYEAEQRDPKRRVAIKVLLGAPYANELTIRHFRREAETLARLKHPNIAAIYEAGHTDDDQRFIAMELVDGIPLSLYLQAHPLDAEPKEALPERLHLFIQICKAINYAHQRGVIHRDLKPSNIVVCATADSSPVVEIKILDFGLARITDPEASMMSTATAAGAVQGTLPYMSPEQVRGDVDAVDVRSDVYSLGVVLFETLTGRPPFTVHTDSLLEAARIICHQPPPRPRETGAVVSSDLETIVLKALEKEPEHRYQSALALAEDVERYLADQPILARPPSTAYQLRKLVSRHRGAFAVTAAVLVLLTVVAITMSIMYEQQRRERLRADAEREKAIVEAHKAEQVTQFLAGMLGSVDPREARGREITVREVLDTAADQVESGLAGQPEVQAAIRGTIGTTYMALGLYDAAERHLREAAAALRRELGNEHPDLASSLNDLAALLWQRGDYQAAEPLLHEALTINRTVYGEAHPEVATSLNNLALLLKATGRYEEAEAFCREALTMRRELPGSRDAEVAVSVSNLGSILLAAGKMHDAEVAYREALALRRGLLGEDHPDVALTLNNLAGALQAQGKYEEAEPLYREVVRLSKRLFGDEHPALATSLNNLASVLKNQGRLDDAEPIYREALALRRRVLGAQHPSVSTSLNNLAGVLRARGQHRKAEALYREALEIRRQALGARHPAVATSLNNLALILQDQGRLADAEPLYREALAIRRERLGNDHPSVSNSLLGLATLLLERGDAGSAQPLLRECVALRTQEASEDPSKLAHAQHALGHCLDLLHQDVEAESLLVSSTEILCASPAVSDDQKRASLERTIAFFDTRGRPEEASPFSIMLSDLERAVRTRPPPP